MSKPRSSRKYMAHRRAVGQRDRQPDGSYICYWCGRRMIYAEMTIDHIVPLSQGGHPGYLDRDGIKTDLSNLAVCCDRCNQERSKAQNP